MRQKTELTEKQEPKGIKESKKDTGYWYNKFKAETIYWRKVIKGNGYQMNSPAQVIDFYNTLVLSEYVKQYLFLDSYLEYWRVYWKDLLLDIKKLNNDEKTILKNE